MEDNLKIYFKFGSWAGKRPPQKLLDLMKKAVV